MLVVLFLVIEKDKSMEQVKFLALQVEECSLSNFELLEKLFEFEKKELYLNQFKLIIKQY